jgi:hypothetical protein
MQLLMRDSVTAPNIPLAGLAAVAGYKDGRYAWPPEWWARFANIPRLAIAVWPQDPGDILDVERGDATPADVPGWCDRNPRGLHGDRRAPTVYCNLSSWPACRQAAGARHVDWFISTLDGNTDVPGAVAVQYRDFGGYDESVILDPSWIAPSAGSSVMDYMAPGPPKTTGDNIARRVQVHEWMHMPGANVPGDWPQEVAMDRLIALWVQSGAEAVFAEIFGA